MHQNKQPFDLAFLLIGEINSALNEFTCYERCQFILDFEKFMRQRVKETPKIGGKYMFPFLLFSFFNMLVVKQQNSIKREYFDAWSMRTKVSNTFKSMMATKSLKVVLVNGMGKDQKKTFKECTDPAPAMNVFLDLLHNGQFDKMFSSINTSPFAAEYAYHTLKGLHHVNIYFVYLPEVTFW